MPVAPKSINSRNRQRQQERRQHSAARGYDERWKRFRLAYITEQMSKGNVLCGWCGRLLDGGSRSIHVDHRQAHNGNEQLMYDETNLQLLHARCHSIKTVKQDGGFGHGKVGKGGG